MVLLHSISSLQLLSFSPDISINITDPWHTLLYQSTLPTRWRNFSQSCQQGSHVLSSTLAHFHCTNTSTKDRLLTFLLWYCNIVSSSDTSSSCKSTGDSVDNGVTWSTTFFFKHETWNAGCKSEPNGTQICKPLYQLFVWSETDLRTLVIVSNSFPLLMTAVYKVGVLIDSITHREFSLSSVLIKLMFHSLLNCCQVQLQSRHYLVSYLQQFFHCLVGEQTKNICLEVCRRNTINDFKWSELSGGMKCSIIPPFSQRKPIKPYPWLFSCKGLEKMLQAFINNLCLSIALWVIGRRGR